MNFWKQTGVFAFGALAALALATSSYAQQTQSETETVPSIADDLSLGEAADQEPQVGQSYIRDTSGDFQIRCVRTADPENDPCQLYQLLLDENEQPVVEVTIFRLPEGGRAAAGATIIVPLETALQQELTIQVDGGTARRYPFSFCNQIGCFARIGLTEEDVNAFRRGNVATLSIVPIVAQDQTVTLTLSLTGFTAGIVQTSVPG